MQLSLPTHISESIIGPADPDLQQTIIFTHSQVEPRRKFAVDTRGSQYDPAGGLQPPSNAVKFTPRRDTAAIEVGSYKENNETIYLVKENGAGFDMKEASLFAVFQRLHSAAEFGGTGVGLTIVHA